MRRTAFTLLLCAPLAFAACGDEAAESAGAGVLDVTLSDFSFGELPDEVAAGTRLQVENVADTELHELVAFRLADGDDRPVDEIVAAGLEDVLSAGPPAAVLLAAPGGKQIAAVGDGVLREPGRYLLLCAIPTGADVQEYLEAAKTSDGPPQVAGGPPHFVHGMVDDLVVTEG